MGLEEESERETKEFTYEGNGELDLEGIDDKELDMYIMTDVETKRKDEMWTQRNADYLQKQKGCFIVISFSFLYIYLLRNIQYKIF